MGGNFLIFPLLLAAALWGGWLHCPTSAKDYKGTPKIIDVRDKGVSRDGDNGVAFANFNTHKFSYLNITSLATHYVPNGEECGFACIEVPSCFSYNLAASYDINDQLLCELLPSDKYNSSDKFVPSNFSHHFSIRSPCKSGPCLNKGTCVSLYSKNSYTCLCVQGYTGTHCEKVDPCQNYQALIHGKRKETYISADTKNCDDRLNGWYRFRGSAGTKMPTSCPPENRCGTSAPGWLNGGHPTVADGTVTRQVCFHSASNCCLLSTNIRVRNCSSFYVYYFNGTPNSACPLYYCGTD